MARAELEQLRRALGDQLQHRAHAEERLRMHEQTVRHEQALALRDYESARAYGGYAALALTQQRSINSEIGAIDAECERLRVLITGAHVEVRKFERLLELQEEREKVAAEKREMDELDEMATIRAGQSSRR
ncbi:hypothetical protein [Terricaulis sp.]|uniref:hypothetical protein n=1 Tax=Terricaulis sp. TaxID=2768686 RepID=UPI0037841F59